VKLLDISPVLSPRVAVWPGDVPFSRVIALSIEQGANIDLSAIHTTVHVGAHTDAPNHYTAGGAGIGERPLEAYYGPCQVMHVDITRNERILPRHLSGDIRAPRVLFRTGTFPDPDVFNEDFAALSAPLIDHLAARGVVLVGIDTASIDLCHDKVLEAHTAVARHDLSILEGVVLDHVEPGLYTLIALPLRLEGADASPVRAVLVSGPAEK
jgi:arylformamidase